jgi:hypothetical protein
MGLGFVPSSPHPPTPNTRINLISRNAALHKPHRDAQHLNIFIPALVIKEQHLVIRDATVSVYLREVRRLAAWIYLHVIEVVYRTPRGARCVRYFEKLEHLAAEIWRRGA